MSMITVVYTVTLHKSGEDHPARYRSRRGAGCVLTEYQPQCSRRSAPPSHGLNRAPDGRSAPSSRYRCGPAACRSPVGSRRARAHGTRSCVGGRATGHPPSAPWDGRLARGDRWCSGGLPISGPQTPKDCPPDAARMRGSESLGAAAGPCGSRSRHRPDDSRWLRDRHRYNAVSGFRSCGTRSESVVGSGTRHDREPSHEPLPA